MYKDILMRFVLLGLILVLCGCSSTSSTSSTKTGPLYSDTMEVIRSAAASAPKGVKGEYILNVKASGSDRSGIYLNTELDYRDQRNITVALGPKVALQLYKNYEQNPKTFFIGKSIKINGEAKRAKIYFYSKGERTEKYYYQTHIKVQDISQIEVVAGQT